MNNGVRTIDSVSGICHTGVRAWLLICFLASVAWAADEDEATKRPELHKPIPAILRAGKEKRKVYLVQRDGDTVRYKVKLDNPAIVGVDVSKLTDIAVRLEYKRKTAFEAEQNGRYAEAISVLLPAVKPHLPYLDIPGHDAIDLAMRTGCTLFHGGMQLFEAGLDDERPERAERFLRAARNLFQVCSEAKWWDRAEDAQYRVLLCTVMLGEREEAAKTLETAVGPPTDVRGYGAFWLAKGFYSYAAENYDAAADAASQSLLFEHKDLSVFPYALLLSGACFDQMGMPYRARDVYFETARLFHRTPPGQVAIERLVEILASGRVDEEEQDKIANVFFADKEDLDKRINDFLELLGKADEVEADEDDEEDKEDKDDNDKGIAPEADTP